jgi:hypothetical protein
LSLPLSDDNRWRVLEKRVRKRTIGSQSDEVKESLRKLHISVV